MTGYVVAWLYFRGCFREGWQDFRSSTAADAGRLQQEHAGGKSGTRERNPPQNAGKKRPFGSILRFLSSERTFGENRGF